MENHFFFMGCWNQDNCGKNDYRKVLLQHILEHTKRDTYDFGIVAGDNVYPHEIGRDSFGKAKKAYFKKTLDTGFSLLSSVKDTTKDKRIYLSIGNHDVSKKKVLSYQIKKAKEGNVYMPSNVYFVKVSPILRIMVIDTNLLTQKPTKIYSDISSLDKESQDFIQIQNEKDMLFEIKKNLSEDPTYNGWTIIVGHEPIVSIKKKMDSITHTPIIKTTNLQGYRELLKYIGTLPKTIYMCADVHSFQAWNIHYNSIKIPMIVVGTGGGIPDEKLTDNIPFSQQNYKLEEFPLELVSSHNPYGFCEVICSQDSFQVVYHPLLGCSENQAIVTLQYLRGKLVKTKEVYPSHIPPCPSIPGTCVTIDDEIMKGGTKEFKEYIIYHGRRYRVYRIKEDRRRKYIQTSQGKVYSPFPRA